MKRKHKILLTVGIGVILVLSFYIITGAITKYTGYFVSQEDKETDFALCLKKQEISVYINSRMAIETLRMTEAYDYLQHVKIVNCFNNNQPCLDNEISIFPTWIINGRKTERDITVLELAEHSGCGLIE